MALIDIIASLAILCAVVVLPPCIYLSIKSHRSLVKELDRAIEIHKKLEEEVEKLRSSL